jgi:hypothetical protein
MVSILVKACHVSFRELLAGEKQRTGQMDTHPGAVTPKVGLLQKYFKINEIYNILCQ